jgi:hypothetical protein
MSYASYDQAKIAQVDVEVLATIVKEIVSCKMFQKYDPDWLRSQTMCAGLSPHEYAALQSLYDQLCKHRTYLSDIVIAGKWY